MRSNDKSFAENLDTVSLLAAYGQILRIAAIGYRTCLRRLVRAKTHPLRKKAERFVGKVDSLNEEASLLAYTYPSQPRLLHDGSMFSHDVDIVPDSLSCDIGRIATAYAEDLRTRELSVESYKRGYYAACRNGLAVSSSDKECECDE